MKVSKMEKFAALILIIVSAQCLSAQAVEEEETFKLESGLYLRKYETHANGKIKKNMGRIR